MYPHPYGGPYYPPPVVVPGGAYPPPGAMPVMPPMPYAVAPPVAVAQRGPSVPITSLLPSEPKITVFVGKISPGISDEALKKLFEKCGEVVNWKRDKDDKTGEQKKFGFCDFRGADAALRAIRLLNGLKLGDSELLVKVDERTQKTLEEHIRVKRRASEVQTTDSGVPYSPTSASQASEKDKVQLTTPPTPEDARKDETARAIILDIAGKINQLYNDPNAEIKDLADESIERDLKALRQRKVKEEEERRLAEEARIREQRMKQERIEQDRERERKKAEREEKEYRRKEKLWEAHEDERAYIYERRRRVESERIQTRAKEIELDAIDDKARRRKIRSRERKKQRMREREQDEIEREREEQRRQYELKRQAEEERRQRAEEERRRREQEEEEERRAREAKAAAQEPEIQLPGNISLSFTPAQPQKPKKTGMAPPSVFGDVQEEDPLTQRRKRPLQLLDDEPTAPDAVQPPQKKRKEEQQASIDKIPTDTASLFAYNINWEVVDKHNIVQSKIRPWVTKKIIEYLGAEETALIDYICKQITDHKPPAEIKEELAIVLEEEAEVFVVKLWRMLIFEIDRASN